MDPRYGDVDTAASHAERSSLKHTDAIRQGHSRAAQWANHRAKPQQSEQQQADAATAPTHCIGDLVIQGHNEQGTSMMQHGTHRLKQIMSRAHIQMMQETNYKPASQTVFVQLVDCGLRQITHHVEPLLER